MTKLPNCPKCDTVLVPLVEYGDVVEFYCTHCRKKVKARRMPQELMEAKYGKR